MLISLLKLLYTLFWLLILARVILSYTTLSHYHPVRRTVENLTEPILAPIRRIIPSGGLLDFSPIIAILIAELLYRLLLGLLL